MDNNLCNNNSHLNVGTINLMPVKKKYKVNEIRKQGFSLVLSGGASFGLAHIGTIKFLEENGLTPSEIIGTSMGSVIGALYAIGETSETIQKKIEGIKTADFFEVKYLQGRIEYDKAKDFLKKIFKNLKIKDAKIPLKIIATKLKDGEEKIFTKKDDVKIYDAVMGSISIPGILNVSKIKNEVYIDGCVTSNLPIEAAEKNNIKLAIDVVNKKDGDYHYKKPKNSFIQNIKTKLEILGRSSKYYIIQQTETKTKKAKKLILIEPNLKGFNSFIIKNHKKIIKVGYVETKKYFDDAEKTRKKYKKKGISLGKIINLPINKARKLIKTLKS